MEYNKILFDLDGTLNESGPGIFKSFKETMKVLGKEQSEDFDYTFGIGPPLKDTFTKLGIEEGGIKNAIAVFRKIYEKEGLLDSAPYKGVYEMLQSLKDAGKTLCVATSKNEIMTNEVLEHFDLLKYFDFVAAATLDETRVTKESVITWALENLNVKDKREVVMVGDRNNDIEGAVNNGIDSIGVLYGYGSEEELKNAGATHIAKDPYEVVRIITGE